MHIEVVVSKIVAQAPPWRFPEALQRLCGMVKENTRCARVGSVGETRAERREREVFIALSKYCAR
jgi:hypothetical protein